jgi:L-gulonate 3-dehydrogenase
MYELAKQQADARKWEGKVVDEVVNERRTLLPVENLQERAKWRDQRLMQLVAHKQQMERSEEEHKK